MFKIELNICIKMDMTLYKPAMLDMPQTKTNNQTRKNGVKNPQMSSKIYIKNSFCLIVNKRESTPHNSTTTYMSGLRLGSKSG